MNLEELYVSVRGCAPAAMSPLPKAGSNRQYVRLTAADGTSLLGVSTTDTVESRCFIYLARHFREQGLPVPQVLAVNEDASCYIQEDLGRLSLYDALSDGRKSGYGSHDVEMLESAVRLLPYVQTVGARGLDWSRLMPPAVFSRRAAMFDLNYFKYMFLRTSDIPFDEDRLEDDMQQLAADLVEMADGHATFLYRDYQARNLMVRSDGSLALIDFQGGKQGPVYYDVASFLMQASAHYGATLRQRLAACYLDELRGLVGWAPSPREFEERLRTFMFFRTLQVLGAYGLRGRFERKPYFLDSIPPALANLRELIDGGAARRYTYMEEVLRRLC